MMTAHLLEVLVADRRRELETTARRWRLSRKARAARRAGRDTPTAAVITLPEVTSDPVATDRSKVA